jgi:hypothetical protein
MFSVGTISICQFCLESRQERRDSQRSVSGQMAHWLWYVTICSEPITVRRMRKTDGADGIGLTASLIIKRE